MLRLPPFEYHRPTSVEEAVGLMAEHGPEAMFVAGGTDLYPNMKRRHQQPKHVIALADVPDLHGMLGSPEDGVAVGAMTRLSDVEEDSMLQEGYPGLVAAVHSISTPLLRNMGTMGGNLLLDTRCTYYNQGFEWRESISFCMKEAGEICWVAPGSPRCWAVQSSDTVPLLCAMGAEVELVSPRGERRVPVEELYRDDGIEYLTKAKDELLVRLWLPAVGGWRAGYEKLRRRGSFDFPVLGVGVCLWMEGGVVTRARVRLGGVGSWATPVTEVEEALVGREPTPEVVREAARLAHKPSKPMDNVDHEVAWRKKMTPVFVERALLGVVG